VNCRRVNITSSCHVSPDPQHPRTISRLIRPRRYASFWCSLPRSVPAFKQSMGRARHIRSNVISSGPVDTPVIDGQPADAIAESCPQFRCDGWGKLTKLQKWRCFRRRMIPVCHSYRPVRGWWQRTSLIVSSLKCGRIASSLAQMTFRSTRDAIRPVERFRVGQRFTGQRSWVR
jgi:hypothetical protein